jgi:excisionase family DNA binding protein
MEKPGNAETDGIQSSPAGEAIHRSLTVKQVAEALAVSEQTVYLLCAEKRLRHLRIGTGRGVVRVRPEDLEAFIENCKVDPQFPMNATGLKHIKSSSDG